MSATRNRFYDASLKPPGYSCQNGKPSIRKDYSDKYYAAYVVDPDGYRL
jgi:hypothetical protein